MWAKSELAKNWRIITACGVGVGAGITGIPFYTLGLFVVPLEQQFGWSRTEVQGMFSVFAIAGLIVIPLIGWMTDCYGSRKVALGALLGTVVGYCCLGLATRSLTSFYVGAALLGILGAGTSPISWTKVIGGWFNKQRGMALGLALAGTGIAGFLAPKYVSLILAEFDWRAAYLGLALIPLVAFFVVFRLLKDPPSALKSNSENDQNSSAQTDNNGVDLQTAARHYRFWLLMAAFFLVSTGIGGTIPNLFPLLTGTGIAGSTVASILGLLGISVILGRLIAGVLLDRLWAPGVAAFMLIMPAFAAVMLSQEQIAIYQVIIAVILVGIAAGAEFDLIAYLVSRYFGLAHYGKIYSMVYAAFFLGSGIAPPIFGYFYDTQGSYSLIMYCAAGLFLAGGSSLLLLGRYPGFEDIHYATTTTKA